MENLNLIDTFSEFKEFKNIERETLMRILEDVFRGLLIKKYGSIAGLTIYDMCKAIDKKMIINDVYLIEKSGGSK